MAVKELQSVKLANMQLATFPCIPTPISLLVLIEPGVIFNVLGPNS